MLQVLLPLAVSLAAWLLWQKRVTLGKFDSLPMWRRVCSQISMFLGIIAAVFQFVENARHTPPSTFTANGAIIGMCLSSTGVVTAIFGLGIVRALMTVLMVLVFAWWLFVWCASFYVW